MSLPPVLHLLSGLEIGGKERVVLDLAGQGRSQGLDHRLLLFDTPFRDRTVDLDPGDIPWTFVRRRPGLDARLPFRIAREVRRVGAGILHAHNDTALFYGALACCVPSRARKPALVGTFHTHPTHPTSLARRATCWASRVARATTAVSDELSTRLRAQGWVRGAATIWNGVDIPPPAGAQARDFLAEKLPIGPEDLIVGHVGRSVPVKRQQDLLAAAALLGERGMPVTFVLVGQGPDLERLQREARGLGNVHFLASVTDVPSFLACLDVFLLCSDHEAAPRALLEAMASGRPIIATDVGGIRTMLTDEAGRRCGVLIPPRQPRRIADEIDQLRRRPRERARLAGLAKARAGFFSREREWAAYQALYRRLVEAG